MISHLLTPIRRIRSLEGKIHESGHWYKQRIYALVSVPLIVYLLYLVKISQTLSRTELLLLYANPLRSAPIVVLSVLLALHFRIGMESIIRDYVHHHALKLACSLLNGIYVASTAVLIVVTFSALYMHHY